MNWQISVSARIYIYYATAKVIYDGGERYIHDRIYNRYEGEVLTDFEKDLGGVERMYIGGGGCGEKREGAGSACAEMTTMDGGAPRTGGYIERGWI